ncbi:hypothetical protein MRB53_010092 [Persea americana]|uniref:Uncharacterized protein n=1 Tax=Persea americana TaxID=3435 RepID=A0ACC2LR74_PERAE|nr:hypothetical protein MRB53_010092 [Persea americana]
MPVYAKPSWFVFLLPMSLPCDNQVASNLVKDERASMSSTITKLGGHVQYLCSNLSGSTQQVLINTYSEQLLLSTVGFA